MPVPRAGMLFAPAAPPPGTGREGRGTVKLHAVELVRLELPLAVALATSAGEHAVRPLVLVRVITDSGEGYGECEALAEPIYTEEYADGAARVLADHLVPRLLAGGPLEQGCPAVEGLERLRPIRGQRMAKAAVEMALLDAWLRAEGRSLAAFLGATNRRVPAGATVGIAPTAEVVARAAEAAAAGYRRVKLKIGPGHALEPLRAVRAELPALALAADANGAYRLDHPEDRRALELIDGLGLAALEQPLAAEDLAGHAELAASLATPVVLDESIADEKDLEAALALGACDGVSLKSARLGGLLAACRVHDRCLAVGVRLAAGGMLESGLGRAASLALAARSGFDLPGDLGGSERYFVPDLTAAHLVVDGELAVPDGPGLGVEPRPDVLAAARTGSELIRPAS